MKALAGLLLLGLTSCVRVSASEALVYSFGGLSDASGHYATTPSISSETARLLLARRLGLSQYHDLGTPDGAVLQILNTFGGNQKRLFVGSKEDEEVVKLLIMVEGIEDPASIFEKHEFRPTLTISDPPSSPNTARLLADFHDQRHEQNMEYEISMGRSEFRSRVHSAEHDYLTVGLNSLTSAFNLGQRAAQTADPLMTILHITELEDIARRVGFQSKAYTTAFETLSNAMHALKTFDGTGHETTIVLMPLMGKNAKDNANTYGSYKTSQRRHNSHINRRQQIEEPISLSSAPKPSSLPSKNPNPSQPQTLKASSSPKGLLPVCYTNNESCISTTNSCSGHGTCQLRYTNKASKDSDSSQNSDCFSCVCIPSTRTSNGLTKHIYWGGSACQKKDVSSPFFLLAGLTVALVAIVSWGVGLLFSIGQEELPSVIGAGVAGPRAQK